MFRMVFIGMGVALLLTGIMIVILQLSRKSKMVQVSGVIQETARDTDTTHDNWANVLVTRPDGTQGLYRAQLRGKFADEHLGQTVTCYIDPNAKQRGNMISPCYVDDGYATNKPGLARAILPASIFLVVGAAMLLASFRLPNG